jgi:hypothetical protein
MVGTPPDAFASGAFAHPTKLMTRECVARGLAVAAIGDAATG